MAPIPQFSTPPPEAPANGFAISVPAPYILLVTITRPKQMNSIPFAMHWAMHKLFTWFDNEPTLRVAVITGEGKKAFCAGQDLIELGKRREGGAEGANVRPSVLMCYQKHLLIVIQSEDLKTLAIIRSTQGHPPSGFAGISRRNGKKPIVAAVNGFALGGGFEIVLNWSSFPSFYIYCKTDDR